MEQNIERQIRNIKEKYPEALIIQDEYTGTSMERPAWKKLYKSLKKGDVVVFDEVSRMSRDAEEGFKVYEELYYAGVELIFLKEPHISTEAYKEALNQVIKEEETTEKKDAEGELISDIKRALKKYQMAKVKGDIKKAFEQAQAENDYRKQRIKEGMALTDKDYKRKEGDKLTVKKAEPIKELIRKYSRDFDGTLTDMELLGVLSTKTVQIPKKKRSGKMETREISAKLSRNTLYKYKAQMREGV